MTGNEAEFDEEAPEVFDFLEELEGNLERGVEHPLSHYLVRYPGREEAISREFLAHKAQAAAVPPAGSTVTTGEADIGPYRVECEIGRGGQGVVYLAEDTRIARRVALKVLPPAALLLSADRKARLRREAEVISKLEHPGICGIYDAEISDELAYIAMHLVEGESLGALIARAARERAGEVVAPAPANAPPLFPQSEAQLFRLLEYFECAARALHAAHEVGVVHRDIKPGNLMVTPEGAPVWLDFGQARDIDAGGAQLTMSGEVFGTPAYISPEQLTGHRDALDPRTDVWALAVSLFEALTLRRPFEGASTQALLFAVQTAEPASARALNPCVTDELEVVLQTGLEKDLDRRYASAAEFADELARIRGYQPIRARPASAALKFRRWRQRHPLLFVSTSGVALVLVVGLLWTLYLLHLEGRALDHALGRHLAERATTLLDEDPAAALALGIEAVELAPSYQTRSALYTALERCYLVGEFDGDPARRFRDIALSPDGALLAAALSDGSTRLYDVESRALVARWSKHPGEATAVAFSADGAWMASADASGGLLVFDVAERKESLRIDSGGGEVRGLEFVTAAEMSMLRVEFAQADALYFDTRDGTEVGVLAREAGVPGRSVLAQGAQGEQLFRASGAADAPLFAVLELESGPRWELRRRGRAVRVLEATPASEVLDAAFSPDATRLAVAASGGGVRLFDVQSGRGLAVFEGLMQAVKLLWTPDGNFVITQTHGPFVQVWFATQRPDVYRLFGGGGALVDARFSADGEHALTLSSEGRVRVWSTPGEPSRARPVGVLETRGRYPGDAVASAALSADGARFAVCGDRGVWLVGPESGPRGWLLEPAGARRAAFSDDGARLLIEGDGVLSRSSVSAGAEPIVLAGGAPVSCARRLPRSSRVVVATLDGGLGCYDERTGRELWRVRTSPQEGPAARVVDLAFHPGGLEVAAVSDDRTVRFLRMADGSTAREPLGVFPPRDIDWSADGTRLLVTGTRGRGAFMVKELASDQRMRVNVFHHGNLTGGSFSPDGSLVMTSSEDGTIFVRDVLTGSPIVLLSGDGDPIRVASFSGGAGPLRVIAALEDGNARVWPVDPLPAARARKPRELYDWELAREVRLALPLEYR